MNALSLLVERLARTDVTVTLTGETGTGKDVFAHLIHDGSNRAEAPFVVFDCGAVPPSLVENELFGHERGSFTGAHAEHQGAFERAHGGTLFLDEIGELPLELQPRLLRVLDNRVVRRVGGTIDHKVDLRVVAATNRDLAALVAAKQFRQDLYFRLAAAVVRLPPLRDRLDDLAFLVPRLMTDIGRGDVVVDPRTLELLRSHLWPGNVRELKNVIERAVVLCAESTIGPEYLPASLASIRSSPSGPPSAAPSGFNAVPAAPASVEMDPTRFRAQVESLERARIVEALGRCGGNQTQAAKLLGVSRRTLVARLAELGLPRPRKRAEDPKV